MGGSYTAKVIVGVPVTKEDFIVIREVERVGCDCDPEAALSDAKFCSECGAPVKVVEKREYPKPEFTQFIALSGVDPDGEEEGWFDDLLYGLTIGKMKVVNLNDHEVREKALVLGIEVMRSGGSRGYSTREVIRGSEMSGFVHQVQDLVRDLGIRDRDVQVFCVLQCA